LKSIRDGRLEREALVRALGSRGFSVPPRFLPNVADKQIKEDVMDVLAEVGSCCVAEVMGTELYTLTPDTVVASAQRLAFDNGINHLLVLENGTLAGIICKEDLRLASRDSLVGECMSSPVLCIGPETTLDEAAQIMVEHDVSCLPVVTGAFLVGIVTRDALATVGLAESETPPNEPCVACGALEKVRRDPRAGGIALCADCLGRTSPNIMLSMAD
jgi:CBS domain-containing protein